MACSAITGDVSGVEHLSMPLLKTADHLNAFVEHITSGRLRNVAHLRLRLPDDDTGADALSATATLLDRLSQLPKLKSLELQFDSQALDELLRAKLRLPALEELRLQQIDGDSLPNAFLATLTAVSLPKLKSLMCGIAASDADADAFAALPASLQILGAPCDDTERDWVDRFEPAKLFVSGRWPALKSCF